MKIEKNTVHRKEIVPWYDSEASCIIVGLVMFFTFWFSVLGVIEACDSAEYCKHAWVPALLIIMSGIVFISTFIRLIKRYIREEKDSYLMDFRRGHIKGYGK